MSLTYFPEIGFNKNNFKSNKLSIFSSYDLSTNDANIVSVIDNDIKILIQVVSTQQTQIEILKTQIIVLNGLIKNLINTPLI